MPGPPVELIRNIQSMEKLHSGENLTPTRRAQNLTIDPRNYPQNESNNRKQYQPHSPSYPRNEEPTPRKKFESAPSDRNLPEVNRKGSIEYQSQSQGGTPLSPRSKQLAQQQQQQPRPNAAATSQSQQLVVGQSSSQRQKPSVQQLQQQQSRNFRPEEIDMKRIEIGLENLGNTCFMNSTLQCLLHIQPLISYFLEGKMENDLNSASPKKGMLATSFNNLIRDIFNGKSGGSIAPVNFQRAVGIFAPYLMDFQQQDSQEFLRFLLDGMSEDLCRRKPELKQKDVPSSSHLTNAPKAKSNSILPVLPQLQTGKSPERNSQNTNHPQENVSQNVIQGREKLSSILKVRHETRVMRDNDDTEDEDSPPAHNTTPLPILPHHEAAPAEVPQSKLRLVKDIQRARKNPTSLSMSAAVQEPNEDEDPKEDPESARSKSTLTQVREVLTGKKLRRRSAASGNEGSHLEQDAPSESSTHDRRGSEGSVGPKPDLSHPEEGAAAIEKSALQSWDRYLKLNDSVITDIFGGLLQSTVQCSHCQHKSYTFDPFLDLSVPISKESEGGSRGLFGSIRQNSGDNKSTLEKCLEKFTAEEILDGDNMVKCEKCKKNRKCSKRLSIFRYPKVLVIHIKRFRFTNISREKLSTDVHFPLTGLDLRPFLSSDIQPILSLYFKPKNPTLINNNQIEDHIYRQQSFNSSNHQANSPHHQNNSSKPLSISDQNPHTTSDIRTFTENSDLVPANLLYYSTTTPVYDLIGVSNHHGSLNGGHYVAHVDTSYAASKGQAPRWMCFNDARVSQANVNSISGPTAYVLFYKLREESSN